MSGGELPGLEPPGQAGGAPAGAAGSDGGGGGELPGLEAPGQTGRGRAATPRSDSGRGGAAAAPSAADLVVAVLVEGGLPVVASSRLAGRLVRAHGPDAGARLREDPWLLLTLADVRLAEVDALARALRVPPDERRGRGIATHVLGRAAADGHTALSVAAVLAAVAAEGVGDAEAAVRAAVDSGTLVAAPVFDADGDVVGEVLSAGRLALAEDGVAEGVARLVASSEPWGDAAGANAVTRELDEAQRRAVELVMTSGVVLLTGGPGTGKSRTVAAAVALARARGKRVGLAAPTGRAAKRLEELCGEPASTLHRLLQAVGTTGAFQRGESWPLDADLVVVDEASMLDVELAAALVSAVPDGAHLLVVGDPAQLPSIGPGRVLGDLVDAGVVPVVELRTLYRQEAGGAIARLATAVRGGTLPADPSSPDREVVVVTARDAAEAAHRVVQLVTDSVPRVFGFRAEEVQVVTPVHRGPAGTVELNVALKAALNPGTGTVGAFDPGDRVVATANNADAGYANGEVGVVTEARSGELTVAFAGGPATVSGRAVADLRHGWAVTVHRAQGSEWPAVVAVLPPEAGGLLSRPLVYTAFTRARRHLSVVHAVGPALVRAVREVGARPRQTRLTALVREAMEAAGGEPVPPF